MSLVLDTHAWKERRTRQAGSRAYAAVSSFDRAWVGFEREDHWGFSMKASFSKGK
jgi:hypothetical protein